jgi:predicted phosphoadenosine phosphosulfate sulfurtransferase
MSETGYRITGRTKKRRTLEQVYVEDDVWSLALARVEHVLDTYDKVAVAFSGGKDSTVTLHAFLEVLAQDPDKWARHLPLRTIFFDEEAIPVETEEYVRRVAARPDVALEWYCLPIKHRNACSRTSPYWWPWAPEAEDRWCRPLPPEAIQTIDGFPITPPEKRMTNPDMNGLLFDPADGMACVALGIRAQESLTRRRILTMRRTGENWLTKYTGPSDRGNLHKAYPIYDMTTEDVWTAPARFGWDYNAAYDRMEMAGVSHAMQRCSPAFGEEPLQKLHTYAACFPDVWDKMTDRVPGVGAAARYALTELYGYHGVPQADTDTRWPDHLLHFLAKHRPGEDRMVADRLKREIAQHYEQTPCPILPAAPCPDTGVSWNFLIMLGMRGDFKNRKMAAGRINTHAEPFERAWHRYQRELVDLYDQWPDRAALARWLGHPATLARDPLAYAPKRYRLDPTSLEDVTSR